MTKRLPLFFILSIAILVGLFHFAGTYLYLYWRLQDYGYDRIVHFFGGFLVAFISLTIIYFKRMPAVPKTHIFVLSLFAALVIGIGWEIFELQAGITAFGQPDYFINNGGDVVADIVGGIAAAFYFTRKYRLKA